MTNKNEIIEQTSFDLYTWLDASVEKKAEMLNEISIEERATILDLYIYRDLSTRFDSFNVLIRLSNRHILKLSVLPDIMEEILEKFMPLTIENELKLKKNFDNMLKNLQDLKTTMKNTLSELKELVLNPKETFEDKAKITKMIKLNSQLIDNCKQFKYNTEAFLKPNNKQEAD